jgi:hypothetical protein
MIGKNYNITVDFEKGYVQAPHMSFVQGDANGGTFTFLFKQTLTTEQIFVTFVVPNALPEMHEVINGMLTIPTGVLASSGRVDCQIALYQDIVRLTNPITFSFVVIADLSAGVIEASEKLPILLELINSGMISNETIANAVSVFNSEADAILQSKADEVSLNLGTLLELEESEDTRLANESERVANDLTRPIYVYKTETEYEALTLEQKEDPKYIYEVSDEDEEYVSELQTIVEDVTLAKQVYDSALVADTNLEVVVARDTFPTLGDKLNSVESSLAQKATPAYVDEKVLAVASGAPKGTFLTVELLQSAKPTGDVVNYVIPDTTDSTKGMLYSWNGTSWFNTGIVYQSNVIGDNVIKYGQVYSKTAFSNINPENLFDNPTFENSFNGWLLVNSDSHSGTEVALSDSFSKGVSVPPTISGNSLMQRVPLTKLVTGEYKVKCRKKTSGASYNGRLVIQLANSVGTTLYSIYDSGSLSTSIMETTFSINKESLLATYPSATNITITFKHTNPSADCIFYEPFIGRTNNNIKYNNFKYELLQSNPLNGLIATVGGDSVCQGISNGGGYAKIIAETENMTIENKGIGGGTIATQTYYDVEHTNPRHWICDDVNNMRMDADFAIWEGGRNDYALNVPLGVLTTDYVGTIDKTTFYGALEHLFRQALVRFKGKKIGFITIHKPNAEPYTNNSIGLKLDDYYNATIATCHKYSIAVCDLYKTSGLITAINDLKTMYTDSSDGLHLNALGYEEYYVPKITAWMKTL